MTKRCSWSGDDPIYINYHDKIWGKPEHNDKKLFEMLILEGAQAGLSWITILKRQQGYREVFDDFDYHKIATYTDDDLDEKCQDTRIIRNKRKVYSVRQNAIAYLKIIEQFGSFNSYIWSYVDNKPIVSHFKKESAVPASTALSKQISKDLKKRGFNFVGETICYAYMQAIGMVNDHIDTCDFKY